MPEAYPLRFLTAKQRLIFPTLQAAEAAAQYAAFYDAYNRPRAVWELPASHTQGLRQLDEDLVTPATYIVGLADTQFPPASTPPILTFKDPNRPTTAPTPRLRRRLR